MSPGDRDLAVALAELRGCMDAGFRDVSGQLGVVVERVGNMKEDLSAVEGRVSRLEARRWPLATVSALTGVAGVAVATVPFLMR